jgi:hypothetical protein
MFGNFTRQKTNPSSFANKTDYNGILTSTVIIILNKWYVFTWVIIRFNGITPSRSWMSSLPHCPPVHTLPFYSTTSIRIPWTCGCIVSHPVGASQGTHYVHQNFHPFEMLYSYWRSACTQDRLSWCKSWRADHQTAHGNAAQKGPT